MQSREAFSVREPSPNPFNSSTTIKYSVTERCTVSGTLYDMLGRQVKSLVNRDTYPGEYDIEIKGDDIPGGVYFIVFRAGADDGNTIISTKKIINLK
jgi:hypothetical protein